MYEGLIMLDRDSEFSVEAFQAELERTFLGKPGAPSRVDTVAFETLEELQQELYPGAVTLPSMLTGRLRMPVIRGIEGP